MSISPTNPPPAPPPAEEEAPPVLKSWGQLYLVVFLNLVLCILLFTLFKEWFT